MSELIEPPSHLLALSMPALAPKPMVATEAASLGMADWKATPDSGR